MLKLIYKLIGFKPIYFVEYLSKSVEIISNEFKSSLNCLKQSIFLYLISFALICIGIITCLTSILLWAALPILDTQYSWILIFLPALIISIGVIFYVLACKHIAGHLFKKTIKHIKLEISKLLHNSNS